MYLIYTVVQWQSICYGTDIAFWQEVGFVPQIYFTGVDGDFKMAFVVVNRGQCEATGVRPHSGHPQVDQKWTEDSEQG